MTYIQPNKNRSILNGILVLLGVAVAGGVFGMVALYNDTVNLSHNIDTAKAEMDSIGAQSTKMNNQIVAMLSDGAASQAAAGDGLVIEEKPQYVTESWPLATHF